jgi:nitrile hydratase subunit beta
MDGIHDLGGRQGFGEVVREVNGPAFHARWEARVFAIVRAATSGGVIRNVDQFRHAVERIDPAAYLTDGYYGRWLGGIETLLREAGVIDYTELCRRIAKLGGDAHAPAAARPAARADRVPDLPSAAGNRRSLDEPPLFDVGDPVRTMPIGRSGHTRLPAYARGRTGTVTAWHGGWVFPDSNAHGAGEAPQHLYSVAFSGRALWGDEAEAGVTVSLDLFEAYLEALR